MIYTRFIALGDSYTEGMSDEKLHGNYRGWADRVADGMAKAHPDFTYANLAIRGKLVKQVVEGQIDAAKKMGLFVVGLDGESEDTIASMKIAAEPIMIVVGSEGKGLARLTREKCDLVISIPISASTESLNASVATSIALFHIDQARRKG